MARYTGATHGTAPTAMRSPRARSRRSSGSVMTASPIHCGAMTSDRVIARSVLAAEMLAGFQFVHRAAIRAFRFAGARNIEIDARMVVPQLHPGRRAGAENAAAG